MLPRFSVKHFLNTAFAFSVLFANSVIHAEEPQLDLEQGEHIAIIGNTMADRMQHDGWFEAIIQARFPEKKLVIRNLGFAADSLKVRQRNMDFGTPDERLAEVEADTVLMMFGFNESFDGIDGVEQFKTDLVETIDDMSKQQYNGKSAPKIVLVSPIAHENLGVPNLPDGGENNVRLRMYRNAMQSVAKEKDIPFVDLFIPTMRRFSKSGKPLTINGVHLNFLGNKFVAEVMVESLFGTDEDVADEEKSAEDESAEDESEEAEQDEDENSNDNEGDETDDTDDDEDGAAGSGDAEEKQDESKNELTAQAKRLESVRAAVQDKNFYWFNYYRTVDGYSMYGRRADLEFVDGQTNREVMRRELDVLFQMVKNRDPMIWAAANGEDYDVDDTNTPDFIPVVTNIPGDKPDGSHTFPPGEEIIEKMKMPEGFKVNLFASEEQFPELVNPVQMAFDTKGRLWVAAWQSYPHWKPKTEMNDKLLILEDTDGDGKADNCKTFATGLHNPTGFEFYGGGVIVAVQPDLMFLRDTDGDDKADTKTRLLHGFDSSDTHHAINSFVFGPGGGLYFQEGIFHFSQVETPYGPVRCKDAALWRYEPRTSKLEAYPNTCFANPHGHAFNHWGQNIVHDATSSRPYDATLITGNMPWPKKHRRPPTVYNPRTRPCPATELVSSENFPREMQEELLVQNVIGDHGILRYKVSRDGSSFSAKELEPLLMCDDPRFRPVDLEFGPRGDLFFTDWTNPIIGHMQHNVRDPNRDQNHGRVYRMVNTRRPLGRSPKIEGASIPELVQLLASPINRIRYRTRIELSQHDSRKVIAAVNNWSRRFGGGSATHLHHLLEALWMHQQHDVVNPNLLERLLRSNDLRVRAAATRVLVQWRDRIPNTASYLLRLAADPDPRVRLEAVRGASYLEPSDGVPVLAAAKGLPTDKFLDFLVEECLLAYPDGWELELGPSLRNASQTAVNYFLDRLPVEKATAFPLDGKVSRHLLMRAGVNQDTRVMAIEKISQLESKRPVEVLVELLGSVTPEFPTEDTVNDLVRIFSQRPQSELQSVRPRLQAMALQNPTTVVRKIGYATMAIADGDGRNAFNVAGNSLPRKIEFAESMRMIPDPNIQAKLYPILAPMAVSGNDKNEIPQGGRFVRIELPGEGRTLTLAEVEIYSGGQNVARRGMPKQKSTDFGGVAARAIDGNLSGVYNDEGQTHSSNGVDDPWWEIDLRAEIPVNRIVVYNRTEEKLGERLEGFTLKVLDANRKPIFSKSDIPAPKKKSEYAVTPESKESQLRRAALKAMAMVRGKESETANMLADLIVKDEKTATAISALNQIPSRFWPAEKAAPMSDNVMKLLGTIPPAERSSAGATDAVRMAKSLADLLPVDQANKIRESVNDLNVKVIRLGTKPHRMAFDQERIVVKPNQAIELIFENTDMMPHNVVVVTPGNLATIGQLAEDNASKLSSGNKPFVPDSNEVLLASKLVQPTQTATMQLVTPEQPGVYPYVCTYPGHWRRMYGSLVVVADVAAFESNPEKYLAENKIEIKDEILKTKRTTTEWKLADFESKFEEEFATGRDFKNGQQMFKMASCISCHQLQGEGVAIGQDLNELSPEYKPLDVLREILEPSIKIDEKYVTQKFSMESGEIISGVVLFEDDLMIRYVENPLANASPKAIRVADIEDRSISKVSIMPKGLLDNLTREEILDLIAYVYAKGDKKHEVYESGHDH